ncbi:MAG: amino acid adenylation domain-containing protein [Calothrix sp. MO_167.B12]|nr:amino acid adenylation domain-containing protein [Calothrix sp. MO_167.B12]
MEKEDKQLNYWKQQLAGASALLELPTDYPRPAVQNYRGAHHSVEIPAKLSASLHQLSHEQGVTLYMTLLGAFVTLLYRYSGQSDIMVGSPVAGRNRQEINGLIGFFVNTLVLRTDLSGNPSFRELLQRVRQVTLSAYSHQDIPFSKLVEQLNPERSLSYHPLFQVMFVLQNPTQASDKLLGLNATPVEVETTTAKFDLVLSVQPRDDRLIATWEYNSDLFVPGTITRMGGHLQTLLESIVTNPQQSIATLPLLTAAQRQQLLFQWNNTNAEYPHNKCIHQLFEQQVELTPDAVAVVFEQQQLTYQQLNTKANQLAHYLQKLGVQPDVLVGICSERSLDMIVGLLAILKAGGAYLPLDPNYPPQRLGLMVEDSGISLLLTQEKLVSRLPQINGTVLSMDSNWKHIAKESEDNPVSGVNPSNLAYVIYTSGSTGKPKGVLVPHIGLGNLAVVQTKEFNLSSHSRILQFASFSFDASVFEIVMALSTGARLCLASQESLLPGPDLIKLLGEYKITHLTIPPSALAVMTWSKLPDLEVMIVAGEATTVELAEKWCDGVRFFNAYGPTESTICATMGEYIPGSGKLPIGRPIANTQIYILDGELQPVPIGVPGELYIGSVGLARGYLHRPQLTEHRFIANPFSNDSQARLYRTGDLGRYLADGNIEYLGRIDNQVKIRGFRIELGEVEGVLTQHPMVEQTVVMVREDVPGDKRLVAYVVANSQGVPTNRQLYDFLRHKLPDYMVPNAFVYLNNLPLTPNGKIDRQTLPIPNNSNYQISPNFVAPRDELELQLTKIWSKFLGVKPIGVKDNFFELGGHSLLAISLWKEIETLIERKLPLTTLFQLPTIEELAKVITQQGWQPRSSSLTVIKSGGDKPPLFCIHTLGRGLEYYRPLATYLSSDRPLYGLTIEIDEDNPGKSSSMKSVEDLAAYYIQDMKNMQMQGPYLLAGFSFGGLVAFEMAQQLTAQGEQVGFLALFDTLTPKVHQKLLSQQQKLWKQQRYLIIREKLSELDLSYLSSTAIKKVNLQFQRYIKPLNTLLKRNYYQFYKQLGLPIPNHLIELSDRKANTKHPYLRISSWMKNYQPSTYPGCITLFRAIDRDQEIEAGIDLDPFLGWQELVKGGLKTYDIPSSHLGMLQDPQSCGLVEKLQTCLDENSYSATHKSKMNLI